MTLAQDDQDRLLRAVQAGVPLVDDPFGALASQVGLKREEVLAQLAQWSEDGLLREISAVLEGSAMGYESALVTGSVPEAELERVAATVSAHPTVTHNYLRNHPFNLWFTIAVPEEMTVAATLGFLARATGVPAFHALPRTVTFKIGVNFDPKTLKNQTAATEQKSVAAIRVSPRDAALFRALQTPLPLQDRPFDRLAEQAGATGAELLEFAARHLGGAIRRYVGTLRHRKLGVRENGMAVWVVPESEVHRVGQRLAQAPEVSHCYARTPIPGFPYTVYSMLHGPDREACRALAAELAGEIGLEEYAVLFSEREFKKTRLRYFLPELEEWWAAHAGSGGVDDLFRTDSRSPESDRP